MITMFASSMAKFPSLVDLIADRYPHVKNKPIVTQQITAQIGHR
jgi:hypothetical protein